MDHINNCDYHAFDTETTGLNTNTDKVIGYSLSGKVGTGYYFPIYYWDVLKEELKLVPHGLDYITPIKALKQIITWNGSFDIRMVNNDLGINLTDKLVAEGMLMKHALKEDGQFALKTTAIELQEYLGLDAETEANEEQLILKENIKKNGGSATKTNYELYKADLGVISKYAAADADLTLRIFEYYYDKLSTESLWDFFFDEEIMDLYKTVTIEMESRGVELDMDLMKITDEEIAVDITKLHKEVLEAIYEIPEFPTYLIDTAVAKFPPSFRGNFAQRIVEAYKLDLPKSAKGSYSLARKGIESLPESEAKNFLLGDLSSLDIYTLSDISISLWEDHNSGKINLSSKKQMGDLVFGYLNQKPISKTKKGKAQFNEDYVIHLAETKGFKWATKLRVYNKLQKIRSSYVDRFLNNHFKGKYYFSYKQHGTISGRYGSDAQQLPRPMEEGEDSPIIMKYNNRIRKFFVAGKGRKFIDCDYESLEPHVFAHVSGDEGLLDIFRKGHDFYSTIAIATEGIEGVSADKKANNYLGKVNKIKRQKAKAYSLGCAYGMSPYALSKTLEVSQEEAEELYNSYMNAYPELKKWMDKSKLDAQTKGYVTTQLGRVRHLPKVKELYEKHGDKLMDYKYRMRQQSILKQRGMSSYEAKDVVTAAYRDYKNGVNNARNFQIQGLSASIVNRAAIKIMKYFKDNNIDAWVCAQVHDQLIFNVPEDITEECASVIQNIMETVVKLSIELKAPPEIANNFYDGH